MKKYKIGYTSGVFDLFHVGHLNILKKAKEQCEYLIVGVSTDEVVKQNKGRETIIKFDERVSIINSIKYVDETIPQTKYGLDGKIEAVTKYKIDAIFVGSDWKGTDKWNEIEKALRPLNCDVVYLPHTDGISTTELIELIKNR